MSDVLPQLSAAWAAFSAWELVAVLLGIAYLLLAVRESLWCWYAAFAGTAIYLVLFWQVGLLMESLLQIYYLVMAVYGWFEWRRSASAGGSTSTVKGQDKGRPITRWGLREHLLAIALVLVLSSISGTLLGIYTDARLPWLDSFTTWGAIITTWMVARKILENWLYWLVIDGISVFLYIDRGLYLTALLFIAYLVIVIAGFLQWRHHYRTAIA